MPFSLCTKNLINEFYFWDVFDRSLKPSRPDLLLNKWPLFVADTITMTNIEIKKTALGLRKGKYINLLLNVKKLDLSSHWDSIKMI